MPDDFGTYFWGGLILLVIIAWIIDLATKKSTDAKLAKIDDNTIKLDIPAFELSKRVNGTWQELMTFGISDKHILCYFRYNDGRISLKTQNGGSFEGTLGGLKAYFDKVSGYTYYSLTYRGNKIKFYKTSNFSSEEWDKINYVLKNASKTTGKFILSTEFKTANTVFNILKHFT